ncbi:DUF805 domain-containing protein [Ferruginibacter paludis]|uniref:DUF805 domain-containing protein n=1 Tax=Ferruginibacter paludis TaxID=1310417 RepID=UPI0025B45011|nr:DUF805 domain-containing protein [Ferruginibacter paludis]MDN3655399.1 DUF805 domain-containing protein [Ferruginibacter paludis]
MFKAPFSFEGRIRRTEYGLTYLIYVAASVAITLLTEGGSETAKFLLLGYVPLLWLLWAQGSKRCHDRGNKGWYQLIPFYAFWMLFADGDVGANEYGLNPKGIGNVDEIDEIGDYLSPEGDPSTRYHPN